MKTDLFVKGILIVLGQELERARKAFIEVSRELWELGNFT